MKKEFLLDDSIWEKSFVVDVNEYKKGREDYVNSCVSEEFWGRDGVRERIIASMNFVFLLLGKEMSKKLGFDLRLEFVNLIAKRVPVRTMADPELVGTGEVWVFIQINMTAINCIVDDIFEGNNVIADIKKFTEDWCQFLEGSMVQEFAHILYFLSVCNSDRRNAFIKTMSDYVFADEDIGSATREAYLVTEIERHGRVIELDFLIKVYPNSWALAWCEEDLKQIKELGV